MDKHKRLLEQKFPHVEEYLLVSPNGKDDWGLFRTKSGGVTIYYHTSDDFYIVNPKKAQHYSLKEIAESWEPVTNTMVATN